MCVGMCKCVVLSETLLSFFIRYNHTTTTGYLDNTTLPVVCISFRFDSFVPLCLSFLLSPPLKPICYRGKLSYLSRSHAALLHEDTRAHPYHTTRKGWCVYLVHNNDDDKVAYFVCFFFISSSINSTDWMKTRVVQHLKMKRKHHYYNYS